MGHPRGQRVGCGLASKRAITAISIWLMASMSSAGITGASPHGCRTRNDVAFPSRVRPTFYDFNPACWTTSPTALSSRSCVPKPMGNHRFSPRLGRGAGATGLMAICAPKRIKGRTSSRRAPHEARWPARLVPQQWRFSAGFRDLGGVMAPAVIFILDRHTVCAKRPAGRMLSRGLLTSVTLRCDCLLHRRMLHPTARSPPLPPRARLRVRRQTARRTSPRTRVVRLPDRCRRRCRRRPGRAWCRP